MGNKESTVKPKPAVSSAPPQPPRLPSPPRDKPVLPKHEPDHPSEAPPNKQEDKLANNKQEDTQTDNKLASQEHEDDCDKEPESQEATESYSETESELSEDELTEYTITAPTPSITLNLKLYCLTDDSLTRTVKLVSPDTPKTVRDIKVCVEKELNIPACCQDISFESQTLREGDSIEMLKIREGDTLSIKYQSVGDIEDVRQIINGMKEIKRFLRQKSIRRRLENGCGQDLEISNSLPLAQVDLLATMYFHPSADPRSKANRLFFVSNNGLRIMHQLHQELLKHPWSKCLLEMKYLEHSILRVLWNLSAAFSIRLLLLERPTLQAVIKSLVRVEIPPNSFVQGPAGSPYEHKTVTSEMLYKAVGTIGNLAEIPNCRVAIASRKDVLDQLLAILTSPTYTYIVSLVASAGLLCLAYSPETHQYLITDNVIEKFHKACSSVKRHTLMDEQLLKYFRCVFYALLLYKSAAKIPAHLKLKMKDAMKEFLESAEYEKISEHEKRKGYIWSTVSHFVKLAYLPKSSPLWNFNNPPDENEDTIEKSKELQELCIEAGIFSLQNVLLSSDTRDILKAEGLVDYIVCMPWHISPDTKAHMKACDLRQFLSSKMQLQPPSLVNLAKAKLAVSHCGLEAVIKARSLHNIVDNICH